MMQKIIDLAAARQAIAEETRILRELVTPYAKYSAACSLGELCKDGETDMRNLLRKYREGVEGNID